MTIWRCSWLFLALAGAHPVNLECNDPRFDLGYQAMHVYIQPNQLDPSMAFVADTEEYKPGSPVHITVRANGSKYVKAPYGVYLALRAQPVLGWKGDYGAFSELTGQLNLSTKTWGDKPCLNTAFSAGAFTGEASLTWTAGPDTVGDVVISLLWGNGVGTDDPLANKFPNMTHAYLHLRTLTLRGPGIPNHPPSFGGVAAVSKSRCVAAAEGGYNLPHSPVFVQKLRTFPARSVTLPAGRCIACREDHKQHCLSARIDCPAEPGLLATESLFFTKDCSGQGVVSHLPTSFAHCPGPEYHSPENLDLERFVHKLQRDYPWHVPDEATARAALAEYRRMLYLIQKFPDAPVVPSKLVDLAWHEHILDTQQYKKDSQALFGRYIHHAPSFGDDQDEAVKAEKQSMLKDQASMFEKYVQIFEDEPKTQVWPTAQRLGGAGARLPDCCKALCVKPNCASCVGCNAVNCGKEEEAADLLRSAKDKLRAKPAEVLPEHFAGYVPLPPRLSQRLPSAEPGYLCKAQPLPGMALAWTIAGDNIYMKQSLESVESWYGIGFSDVEPYDMSYADFIVTMFNKNYSGVRDMYKFDKGNNYPCWDVLGQCSLNGTAGTADLKDRSNTRQNGISTSTWTRKLVTGDYKDSPIKQGSKKVLFARGIDDFFTYHGKAQAGTCDVDFFSGEVSCGKLKADKLTSFV